MKRESTFGNHCVHYAGLLNPGAGLKEITSCHAGVEYASVCTIERRKPGWLNGMPCFKEQESIPCAARRFPNEAEIAAHAASLDLIIAEFFGARAAIKKHAAGKVGVAGEMDCPVCKTGQLRYTIAECNGHVHARCSTADCVSFME